MYRNPLNNGNLSDFTNSLKNQRDYGARVKKYEKIKLETIPTELQKYYQYLTYQQPILDEMNYTADRMRNEDINKQKENFNLIEDLKIQREKQMKQISNTEKALTPELKNELFDEPQEIMDLMPTINTDIELQTPTIITDNELFDEIEASNRIKASIKRAEIQPLYRLGVEFQKKEKNKQEKIKLPRKVDIQKRIKDLDPRASVSGNKKELMARLEKLRQK